ncbi:MAG: prepilin-type N-terminal cleavage/methylation domain-containing protein [Candidatus Omnitrophota bacterium]
MQKSITLIELLISLVLIGVVILAVFGIYNASSGFFTSSDTKSEVLNEMAYLLDHIDKNVYKATGWVNNKAVDVDRTNAPDRFEISINQDIDRYGNRNETPINFSDDTVVSYHFNTTDAEYTTSSGHTIKPHTVAFIDHEDNLHKLTNRLVQNPRAQLNIPTYDVDEGILTINNLFLCYDPEDYDPVDPDQRNNPTIEATSQRFSTSMQSLN